MIRSIQGRLNLAFIGLTLITFAVLWLLQGMTLRNTAYENVGDRMKSDALTVLRALEPVEDGSLRVNPQVISAVYQQPMSGHYFQYQVDGDIWRYSRSLWDEEIPTYDGRPIGEGGLTLQRKNNKPWLVYDTEFTKAGHKVRIVLAEDVSHIDAVIKRLSLWVAAIGVLFIVVLLIAQIVIIRTGLHSLNRVREDIVRLKEGELRNLPESHTLEVAPLVDEINYLADSMCVRLERSRNAVGNLAHAAKTPLTVIDRQIEALSHLSPECAKTLQQQSQQLRELLERELTRARIAGSAMPGQRVLIEEELAKLIRTMKMIHRDKDLNYEVQVCSTTFFPGERDDLAELMGNLVDNASKWANSTVRVRGKLNETCLELCIEDDGPGIPEAQRSQIVSRGARLDESVSGHGLGLSIVAEIVRQYQGKFELLTSPLGGLHVHLLLPRKRNADMHAELVEEGR